MATSTIPYASTRTLTSTYITNSYVSQTAASRVYFMYKNGFLTIRGNLQVTAGGTLSDFIQIMSVSGIRMHGDYTFFTSAVGQNTGKQLTVAFDTNRILSIYAPTLTADWYRFNVTIPLA